MKNRKEIQQYALSLQMLTYLIDRVVFRFGRSNVHCLIRAGRRHMLEIAVPVRIAFARINAVAVAVRLLLRRLVARIRIARVAAGARRRKALCLHGERRRAVDADVDRVRLQERLLCAARAERLHCAAAIAGRLWRFTIDWRAWLQLCAFRSEIHRSTSTIDTAT